LFKKMQKNIVTKAEVFYDEHRETYRVSVSDTVIYSYVTGKVWYLVWQKICFLQSVKH